MASRRSLEPCFLVSFSRTFHKQFRDDKDTFYMTEGKLMINTPVLSNYE